MNKSDKQGQLNRLPQPFSAIVLMMSLLVTLAGCAEVGPDYVSPQTEAPAAWHSELREGLSAEALDPRLLANWWTTLDDPLLTELVQQAVGNNLDLQQAKARVSEARARRGVSRAGEFPTLDATGSAQRSKGSESTGGGATNSFYAMALDAGWEIDLFGGVRRSVEAADADLAASKEDLRDVLVALISDVALSYLDTRTFQSRLTVAEHNIAIQQETYELIRSRYESGLSDELTLQQARSNLENTQAQLPALRSSLETAKNRLAVLTGKPPGAVHELLAEVKPLPVIPPTVAVGVPAETLRQRPDVRRAERNLAAQTARIGVATADLYPKLRLTGSIGLESLKSADLLKAASSTWNLGPSVSWNIFDAGAIRHNIEIQSAIGEQLLLAYRSAVLTALEEVENALTAYAEEQLRRQRLLAAADAARQAESLAENQYQAGMVDFTTVLDSQRTRLSYEDQLALSDGAVTANLVRLYKALGGGWSSNSIADSGSRIAD